MISGSGNTFLKSPSVTLFFFFSLSFYFFLFFFSSSFYSIDMSCHLDSSCNYNEEKYVRTFISFYFSLFLFLSSVSQKRRRVNRKIFLLSLSPFSLGGKEEKEEKEEREAGKKEHSFGQHLERIIERVRREERVLSFHSFSFFLLPFFAPTSKVPLLFPCPTPSVPSFLTLFLSFLLFLFLSFLLFLFSFSPSLFSLSFFLSIFLLFLSSGNNKSIGQWERYFLPDGQFQSEKE